MWDLSAFFEAHENWSATAWDDVVSERDPELATAPGELLDMAMLPAPSQEHYCQLLEGLHAERRVRRYLEIGVLEGETLAFAGGADLAVGVDPEPRLPDPRFAAPPFRIEQVTSDRFFAERAAEVARQGPLDMAFVDGLHIFEFALRDFIGAEAMCGPGAVICLHDVLPRTFREALRIRNTGPWVGDVWRVAPVLRRFRPDLRVRLIGVEPTGLLVIDNLNPDDRTLSASYREVVDAGLSLSLAEMMSSRDAVLQPMPRL